MLIYDVFTISSLYVIFNKSSIEGHEDLHYDPNDAVKIIQRKFHLFK